MNGKKLKEHGLVESYFMQRTWQRQVRSVSNSYAHHVRLCCNNVLLFAFSTNININDILGDYSLTLVDSLDTLAVMVYEQQSTESEMILLYIFIDSRRAIAL